MMKVDTEKCVGCKRCVKDCFSKDIEIVDGKAKINNITCIKCGHCVAVCPKNAISTDEYSMEDVKEYNREEFSIEADTLLNFIKFRRSIRHFKDKKVEDEKLLKIIETGRFTQTASNMQDVSYIVVKEGLEELKGLVYESLKSAGEKILENLTPENMIYKRYAELWINMYKAYKEDSKNDRIFFNAPSIIVVTSVMQVNAVLASSNMELMVDALGLGTFFSGFFVKAAEGNKKIRELLGVKEGKEIVTCMVIGYPDVKYRRTVPRKAADISWK